MFTEEHVGNNAHNFDCKRDPRDMSRQREVHALLRWSKSVQTVFKVTKNTADVLVFKKSAFSNEIRT